MTIKFSYLTEQEELYFINEAKVFYRSSYKIGDIVFVKNNDISNHLFIIIDNNFCNNNNYSGMIVSSKLEKLMFGSNEELLKNKTNGLRQDSIVKVDKLYIIDNEDILFKIGSVSKEKITLYKKLNVKVNFK